ncbi:hypothetical protein [Paenarthrobacter sp. RAF54_2]|uniref:hypothetical protein n=1 Tax=Paenarthrobacter sp. RAF54_2 TaxID=3233061 RepID=UPI003F9D3834
MLQAQLRPAPIRRLRDLARYPIDLIGTRTAEKNRVMKLLEDAGSKLSVVASDIFGVSGRAMMAALIDAERNPKVLAQLARSSMRNKITELEEAFTGRFDEHPGFLLARMLARIDGIDADITALEEQIEAQLAPFALGGWNASMRSRASVSPPPLLSWPKSRSTCPGSRPRGTCVPGRSFPRVSVPPRERPKATARPDANRYIALMLGEAAVGAGRTDTFLGERYRRIARRQGKKRAIGADHFTRHTDLDTKKRGHVCDPKASATPSPRPLQPDSHFQDHRKPCLASGCPPTHRPEAGHLIFGLDGGSMTNS